MLHDSVPLDKIFEGMTTAIISLNRAERILYLNPAAENLLGSSVRKKQQFVIEQTQVHHPSETRIQTLAAFAHRVYEENNQTYIYREMTLHFQNDREIIVDCCVSPLYGECGIEGSLFEISPVDRILQISREEQLTNQYFSAREIARGLAHEINNPLGGLRGAAQLLSKALPRKDLQEYTDIIIREADRLQKLVKNMLGPNAPQHKQAVDIHDILNYVLSLIQAESEKGIIFKRDFDPSIPLLMLDREQMIQVILNVAKNAWQASNDHDVITLRTRSIRNFTIGKTLHKLALKLDIIDTGPGIPDPIREYIFYPMVSGRSGGSGLGLSIAQSLITQHGGLIEFDSQPGNTCFSLYLPFNTQYSEHYA